MSLAMPGPTPAAHVRLVDVPDPGLDRIPIGQLLGRRGSCAISVHRLNKKTARLQLVPEGTDRDGMRLEADLRALDEALRFSARATRWPEGDTGNEGMPPDEIQKHRSGIFEDFKFDELPEGLRFLGWATFRETETEIVVTAVRRGADPLLLGSWPRSVWLEYVRRLYGVEGG